MRDARYYQAYMEHRTVSRRGLLRGLFAGIKQAGEPRAEAQAIALQAKVIRPPYAREEALFAMLCSTECHACQSACPEGLIQSEQGLPVLDFTATSCSRCQQCVKACPSGALALLQPDSPLNIQAKPVLQHTCHNTFSTCQQCADSCTVDALIWQAGQPPQINHQQCDGCGACAFSCHVNALQMLVC
ncbi:MAG: 4Fe-4S binding protein [Plesiomonas sp.]